MIIFGSYAWSIIFTFHVRWAGREIRRAAHGGLHAAAHHGDERVDSKSMKCRCAPQWEHVDAPTVNLSNSDWCTNTVMVSMPEGVCLKLIVFLKHAKHPAADRPRLIMASPNVMTEPSLPAMPWCTWLRRVLSTTMSARAFLMLIGMPSLRTGKIASSWTQRAHVGSPEAAVGDGFDGLRIVHDAGIRRARRRRRSVSRKGPRGITHGDVGAA